MSHHIKSLFNHLTAINNYTNSSPSSSSSSSLPHQTPQQITKLKPVTTLKKPLKQKLTSTQRPTRRRLITPPPPTQPPPPLLQLPLSHRTTTTTDSGLEISISSSSQMRQQTQSQKCQCETCSRHIKHRLNIAKRLRQAYTKIKTHHSSSNSSQYYAHIPLLVVKSFRPSTTNESKRNEIHVKKNTAVNALYMVSKWIYVKTSDDLYGFIPRKSCQPFVNNTSHTNNMKNHTYASIGDLEQNNYEEQTDLSLFMVSNCYYNNDNDTNIIINEENYEFLPDLKSKSPTNTTYIDLRDVETLPVSTQIIYECLNELKSSSLSTTYDYLNGCQSSSSSNEPNNHYDILMTYKSTHHDTNNYVNASSSSTSNCSTPNNTNNNYRKMNLFKVIKDYEASFKGDLSVNKGDLVYLIDNAKKSVYLNLNQCKNNDDNEWAFVRLFRRTRVTNEKRNESSNNNNNNIYENLNDLKQLKSMQLLQGFVPRSCFIKI